LLCAGGIILSLGVLISGIADVGNGRPAIAAVVITLAVLGLAFSVAGLVVNLRRS
jgi:hypothetical protein